MTSKEIRKSYLDFFYDKNHKIVASAPITVKNDPTLMFTNAGMNQFKDIFLGETKDHENRVANSQKCLRVSGKHNDLEEVGHDTYHHTMFEMLGNWSFGDYFKQEAIDWGWEYLTGVLKLDKERLYATYFEGSQDDGLDKDAEAEAFWSKYLPNDRVLPGNKKDNFWEMGESGPCGPCSEIHIDLRSDEERQKVSGRDLVNQDHPLVIEIWNLVFIQYNRKADTSLERLPNTHVDTGMGFERLCMAVQGKLSNYDTDVFQPLIQEIAKISGKEYGIDEKIDIALRVIADHVRAVAFTIADGQLPSNNKAGYVIRRILRRAVRYGYSFLGMDQPFIYALVSILDDTMGDAFEEIRKQKEFIQKVIKEEEQSFLRTLANGIKLLENVIAETKQTGGKEISGKNAFVLYDTYGFPKDLTELILQEQGLGLNQEEFSSELDQQKNRSKADAKVTKDDWVVLKEDDVEEFIGYTHLETDVYITKYRKIEQKGKALYQLVFNITPFYAESGGQVGDTGYIENNEGKFSIINTIKENKLNIHIASKLPEKLTSKFKAVVNQKNRANTESNHSATHLMHLALREILGTHVEQKGSLVNADYLRFDFSHFQKVTDEELTALENKVNELIRRNSALEEKINTPIQEALDMGAMALFGEKYDDLVRVIKFDESVELCGGTHVDATGKIGYFKIVKESAVAAGIRRIEAITSEKAHEFIYQNLQLLQEIENKLQVKGDVIKSVDKLIDENKQLKLELEKVNKMKLQNTKTNLISKIEAVGSFNLLAEKIMVDKPGDLKDLAFQLKGEIENLGLILGTVINNKPQIAVMISDNLVEEGKANANSIIKQISSEIRGGGGGQPFFATAGGINPEGIETAITKAKELILEGLKE